MFTLETQACKAAHINVREEKHGDEDVLAVDLKITAKVSNDFLSQLHPTLKHSLYAKPDEPDLANDAGYAPLLRYSQIETLKWTGEITGGTLTIHAPISKRNMIFTANVKDLRLTPEDGGTVGIQFTAQFNPDADHVARLVTLLGKTVDVSVEPPKDEVLKDAA